MLKKNIIKLGRGLEKVAFGFSQSQVEEVMGKPSIVDTFADEEVGESQVWHFDEINLSFTFEEEHDFKLSMISVNDDSFVLRDSIRVGMKKGLVLDTLELLNLTEYAEEDHSNEENPSHTLVTIDEKSLYLWFDDDVLSEIQWFPFYNDDEEVIWP